MLKYFLTYGDVSMQLLDFPGAKVGFINELKFVPAVPHEPVPCYRILDDYGRPIKGAHIPEVRFMFQVVNAIRIENMSNRNSYYKHLITTSGFFGNSPTLRMFSFLIDPSQPCGWNLQMEKSFALRMYHNMVTLQTMDTLFYEAQRQGRFSFYLTTIGEEAINIASAAALHDDDIVYAQVCSSVFKISKQSGF